VNRRIDESKEDMGRQFADMNRRFDELKQDSDRRFDAMAKDIAAIPFHIDRLIHEMNISNRLAVIERQSPGLAGLLEK
jgi:hypothetical protein